MTSTQELFRAVEAAQNVKVWPKDNIPRSAPIDQEVGAQKMKKAREIAARLGKSAMSATRPAVRPGQIETCTTEQGSVDQTVDVRKATEKPEAHQQTAKDNGTTKSPKLKDIQDSLNNASDPGSAIDKPKEPKTVALKAAEKAPEVTPGPRKEESADSPNKYARPIHRQAPPKEATQSRTPIGHNGLTNDKFRCYQNATYQNLANLPGLVRHLDSLEWAQHDPDADPKLKHLQIKGKGRSATSEKKRYRDALRRVKSSL